MTYGFAPLQRKAPEPLQRKAPRKGRCKGSRNVQGARYGTRTYWMERLDRDRPELAKLVRAGRLSANAAAVRAGFRKANLRVVGA